MAELNLIQREKLGIRRYNKKQQFNFDALMAPPLFSLISPYDAQQVHDICLDPRLNNRLKDKERWYKEIFESRGFRFLGRGTNRVVFKHLENQNIVLKVPLSEAGRTDNPAEFHNQHLIKPFCTKVFEVSPDGLIGLFERGELIRSDAMMYEVADQIFDFYQLFLGKYIMADVGSEFRKNWLIRPGFGAILGDFPLIYNLDGSKLYCNQKDFITDIPCGGEIDYDTGYNRLYCRKCGKQYFASSLAKKVEAGNIVKRKDMGTMEIIINKTNKEGQEVREVKESIISSKSYIKNVMTKKQKQESNQNTSSGMTVCINRSNNINEKVETVLEDKVTVETSQPVKPDIIDENLSVAARLEKEGNAIEQEQQALQALYHDIQLLKEKYNSQCAEYNDRLQAMQKRSEVFKAQYEEYIKSIQEEETEGVLTTQDNKEVTEEILSDVEEQQTTDSNLEEKREEVQVTETVKEEEQQETEEDPNVKYFKEQLHKLSKKFNKTIEEVESIMCSTGFDLGETERILRAEYKAKQEKQSIPFPKQKSNSMVEEINSNSKGKYPAKKKHYKGNEGY